MYAVGSNLPFDDVADRPRDLPLPLVQYPAKEPRERRESDYDGGTRDGRRTVSLLRRLGLPAFERSQSTTPRAILAYPMERCGDACDFDSGAERLLAVGSPCAADLQKRIELSEKVCVLTGCALG